MKRFLALCFALIAALLLLPHPAVAQITVREKAYIPDPHKIKIQECDFVRMVDSLSFGIVEKEANGKYYDLVSEKNSGREYQMFTVELKNCRIEQAEKSEWVMESFSSLNYKFLLANFLFDIDTGKTPDGFNKVLRVLVKVYLETGSYMSLEKQEFFDKLFRTLKLETLEGEMSYHVFGNGADKFLSRSPGEIQRLEINIRPHP